MQDQEDVARLAIYEYLRPDNDGTNFELEKKARIAIGLISAEARREAARNNAIGVLIAAAGKMTDSPEFAQIMRIAMPDLSIVKALGPGKSDNKK